MSGLGRFDTRGNDLLTLAAEEARHLRHNWIGTEHLLLGLVRQHDGVSGSLLDELEIELEPMRDAVRTTLGEGDTESGGIALTPRVQHVIGIAEGLALGRRQKAATSEHVFFGLLEDGDGVAVQLLRERGIEPLALQKRLADSLP